MLSNWKRQAFQFWLLDVRIGITLHYRLTQVEFAESKETADDRANIGSTIIGAPFVGQQLAQYILIDHQYAEYRPMIRLELSRQL